MGDAQEHKLGDSFTPRGESSTFVNVIQRQTQAALMNSLTPLGTSPIEEFHGSQ